MLHGLLGPRLSVNLNKVALLRNQRDIGYPSVVGVGRKVIEAGAHGLTVHPRPDGRHIRQRDVTDLSHLLEDINREARDAEARIEFNVEGNPTPDFMALVSQVRPDQVTLVPDEPHAKTSDHGWDIAADRALLTDAVGQLKAQNLRVALFVDCEVEVMTLAREVGADRVELYTEPYAKAFGTREEDDALGRCVAAAAAARAAGLGVNAGHDLNLDNLPRLATAVPWLLEVSIGHAISADALLMGFPAAVSAYLAALSGGSGPVGDLPIPGNAHQQGAHL